MRATPRPPDKIISEENVLKGSVLYSQYCGFCHGGFGKMHRSGYLDLSKLGENTHDQFNKIVLDGALNAYGMAKFSDVLKPEDVKVIHDFLINTQRKIFEEENNQVKKR
jgi:quinohemoprotein ethanol dehydrogenase